jgi:Bacterial TSP3 repeat
MKALNHFLCFIFLLGFLTLSAHAILDVDNDGMSDVWEQQYGFSSTGNANANQASTADPDGDGFSNQLESIAGTDPLSSTPPLGIYRIIATPNLTNPLSLDLQ